MVASRQFGACFLVMLAPGALLLATTQFLPELVQEDFGYNATMAGVMVSPGGVVAMVMMVGRRRPYGGRDPAKIPDRRWGGGHRGVDVCADQCLRRSRLLVHGARPDAVCGRDPIHVYSDHRDVLRRHPARQDRPGLGLHKRGAQYRRLDRHL